MKERAGKRRQKEEHEQAKDADDYLHESVELEEAAEKWRGGDSIKSARFYKKALEKVDEGLLLFPRSFDLLYNRARAQYTITQYPRLIEQFAPSDQQSLLRQALDSHRAALQVDPFDPDLLFNSAQVLTSLSDAISDTAPPEQLEILEDAVTYLNSCFEVQQNALRAAVTTSPISTEDTDSTENEPDTDTEPHSVQKVWAQVEEPMTAESLAETAIALLEAVTSLCNALSSASTNKLPQIVEMCQETNNKCARASFAGLTPESTRTLAIASATLRAALLDVTFRAGKIDYETYGQSLENAFEPLVSHPDRNQDDANALCAYAEALLDLSTSIAINLIQGSNTVRWSCLEKAQRLLEQASKFAAKQDMAKLYMTRADTEMLRFSLTNKPDAHPRLANDKTRFVLTNNAEKYYRGARLYAQKDGNVKEAQAAHIRELISSCLARGRDIPVNELKQAGISDERIQTEIVDMVEVCDLPTAMF